MSETNPHFVVVFAGSGGTMPGGNDISVAIKAAQQAEAAGREVLSIDRGGRKVLDWKHYKGGLGLSTTHQWLTPE